MQYYPESIASAIQADLTGDGCMLSGWSMIGVEGWSLSGVIPEQSRGVEGEVFENLKEAGQKIAAGVKTVQDAFQPPKPPKPPKASPTAWALLIVGGLLLAYGLGKKRRT